MINDALESLVSAVDQDRPDVIKGVAESVRKCMIMI